MLDGADVNSGLDRWMTVDRGALESFVAGAPVVNPLTTPPTPLAAGQLTPFPNAMFNVEEEITSAYTQFNFTGEGFRGNLGLRYVMTDQSSAGFTGVGGGRFLPNSFSRDYNDWLPSFNFAMDVADDVVVRLSASRSMARANFADLASFVELDNTTNSGRGGNPNLDPYRASNFDLSAEWYLGNEGLLAVTLFYKDVRSFIVGQSATRAAIRHQLRPDRDLRRHASSQRRRRRNPGFGADLSDQSVGRLRSAGQLHLC